MAGTSGLRELAERLLNPRYPVATAAAAVQLLPEALPEDLPLELPLPPGSRLIGSSVIPWGPPEATAPPTGRMINVVLDAPRRAADLLASYDRAMADLGRQALPRERPHHGGFASSYVGPPTRIYCQSPHGPSLEVIAHERGDGLADVRLRLETASAGLRAGLERRRQRMPYDEVMPPLEAPPGVRVEFMGASGGGGRWQAVGRATTEIAIDELEAHFAGQLEAAGWIRRDGGVDGRLAWSFWAILDGDWRGLLMVVDEPEPRRRFLHLRVEQ